MHSDDARREFQQVATVFCVSVYLSPSLARSLASSPGVHQPVATVIMMLLIVMITANDDDAQQRRR